MPRRAAEYAVGEPAVEEMPLPTAAHRALFDALEPIGRPFIGDLLRLWIKAGVHAYLYLLLTIHCARDRRPFRA